MNFLLAPDSFKGSLTSVEVAEIMQDAILQEMPDAEVVIFPLADGGEGTLQACYAASGGSWVQATVLGPLGNPVEAKYLRQGDRAIVELAQASGLTLVAQAQLDPLKAGTYGTGEQIRHAIVAGAKEVVLGIGGSATNDAGLGILSALGAHFIRSDGSVFVPSGGTLDQVVDVDLKDLILPDRFIILCDVSNPLVGQQGAARVYAPQKGADPEHVELLEANMLVFADRLQELGHKRVHDLPGGGAAGGVGGGLYALAGAELIGSIDFLMHQVGLKEALLKTDLVVTGEGKLDKQTLHGKVIAGISKETTALDVPLVAICGTVELTAEEVSKLGLQAAVSIQRRCHSLEKARVTAKDDLLFTTRQFVRSLQLR